jgi:hypothetical protein
MAVPSRCDTCGQVDDHPKFHYGNDTYHHDCLPYKVTRDLTTYGYWMPVYGVNAEGQPVVIDNQWVDGDEVPESEQHQHNKNVLALKKKAESGVHGDKLAAFAATLPAQEG